MCKLCAPNSTVSDFDNFNFEETFKLAFVACQEMHNLNYVKIMGSKREKDELFGSKG